MDDSILTFYPCDGDSRDVSLCFTCVDAGIEPNPAALYNGVGRAWAQRTAVKYDTHDSHDQWSDKCLAKRQLRRDGITIKARGFYFSER